MRALVPPIVVAPASACVSASPASLNNDRSSQISSRCDGQLEMLRGPEITSALVGASVHFADDQGVCPASVWVTSAWELSLASDGQYTMRGDRSVSRGSYVIASDQLCLGGQPSSCSRLYRDELGRLYLGSEDARASSQPAMISVEPLPSTQ